MHVCVPHAAHVKSDIVFLMLKFSQRPFFKSTGVFKTVGKCQILK